MENDDNDGVLNELSSDDVSGGLPKEEILKALDGLFGSMLGGLVMPPEED